MGVSGWGKSALENGLMPNRLLNKALHSICFIRSSNILYFKSFFTFLLFFKSTVSASFTSPTSQVLSKEKQTVRKEGSLLVPIWVVILVAILCFTAFCVTAFLLVRWNKRYSGSFNPENMNLSQNHTDKRHSHETQSIEKCDPLYTKV